MRNSIFIYLIIFSSISLGEELTYNFQWSFINVAKLKLDLYQAKDFNNKLEFYSYVSTSGPLKLFRNYTSRSYGKNLNNKIWRFELIGKDRGQDEHKQIDFFDSAPPEVNIFIDDKGVKPLELNTKQKERLIDPISVLLNTISGLRSNLDDGCTKVHKVYDGKRIYKVYVSDALESGGISENDELIHCRYRILNNLQLQGAINPKDNMKNWPFNRNEKIFDVWFSKSYGYIPTKFLLFSPVGKIIGSLEK